MKNTPNKPPPVKLPDTFVRFYGPVVEEAQRLARVRLEAEAALKQAEEQAERDGSSSD